MIARVSAAALVRPSSRGNRKDYETQLSQSRAGSTTSMPLKPVSSISGAISVRTWGMPNSTRCAIRKVSPTVQLGTAVTKRAGSLTRSFSSTRKTERGRIHCRFARARLRGLLTSRNVLPKDPLLRTQSALDDAFDAYEPKPYDGRVVLFRSAQQPFGIRRDAALGWNGFPAELEVRTIPAYFTTIVYEPAVRLLAVELRGYLEDLDRRARADPLVGGSVRI